MSESRPAFRHTPGEWGKHPSYCNKFELSSMIRDDGSAHSWCTIVIASGDLRIAEVQFSSDGGAGWPQVKNFNEFKANVALMSAAPNLLDACSQLLGEWDTKTASDDFPSLDTIDLIRAAVSKATTY